MKVVGATAQSQILLGMLASKRKVLDVVNFKQMLGVTPNS